MTRPASVHRPSDVLSPRDRKALGKEYAGYIAREKLPGEAPPRTIGHQKWAPIADLAWQNLRTCDAVRIESFGAST
jgi:hypothetical protein